MRQDEKPNVILLWDSSKGPAKRVRDGYIPLPIKRIEKRKLTEAEYNAEGRAKRRRQNRRNRGWLPYAKR